jgi:hypothetical protein
MQDIVYGTAGELLGAVFFALVAVVLAVVGALAELAASQNLSAGQMTLGVWEAGVGLIALYAAYSVATEFVLPRLGATDAADASA